MGNHPESPKRNTSMLGVGQHGFQVFNDANNHTDLRLGILKAVTDCVIASVTSTGGDLTGLAGVTVKAGDAVPLPVVTQLQLTSGTMIGYKFEGDPPA